MRVAAAVAACSACAIAAAAFTSTPASATPWQGMPSAPIFSGTAGPTVTHLSKRFSELNWETLIVISGSGFEGTTAVHFGSQAATSFTVESDTTIKAWAPPEGSGAVDVTVTTPAGTSEPNPADVYTYTSQAVIEGIDPSIGPEAGGTGTHITGVNLEGARHVKFGSAEAESFHAFSGISLNAVAPPGTGSVHITVATENNGTSEATAADLFSYVEPQITGLSPNVGGQHGGTSVTITGKSFYEVTAVEFGLGPEPPQAESFVVNSPTSITAVTPPGTGSAPIEVVTTHGSTAWQAGVEFTWAPPPTVYSTEANTIQATSAAAHSRVDPHGIPLEECLFEFGTSPAYGDSVACTEQNGVASASLTALSRGTEYHFRIALTDGSGTTYGPDTTFVTLAPPEFGRCIKVTAGTGQYGGSNCTALGGEKKYEWFPASASAKPLVKSRFTTKLKEKTEAKLLTSGGKLISCTGESGTGEYTGRKSLGNVALTFTGCQLAGAGPCESSGAAAGEVHTVALEGTLGLIKASVEGPAKNTIGTALKPATGELVAAFSCNGTPVTVKGSVIGEVKRNAMTTKAPIKFAQAKAIQKPVRFEGGEEDVLTAAFGEGAPFERTGLAMITNKTDEERIEANSVF